jgi:pyridoxine 4-dehydrogenase
MDASSAETVRLGATSTVRRIGLGTMKLTGPGTWGPPRDLPAARSLLCRARDLGVDFFDTADAYGPGMSEELLREALHPFREIVVATKGGHTRQGPSMWKRDGRPEHLREACHASLRRLGIDCIDLYQLHAVDPGVPIEESLGALVVLQQEGKIKHIGVCNVTVAELERARAVATIASAQNRFSVLDKASDAVLAMCERVGIVFIPWAPLGGGRLADSRGDIARVARRLGATRSQVVLAWLLYRSASTLPIPGTRSVAHLEENLAASSVSLGPDDLFALERPVKLGLSPRHLARDLRRRARRLRRRFT